MDDRNRTRAGRAPRTAARQQLPADATSPRRVAKCSRRLRRCTSLRWAAGLCASAAAFRGHELYVDAVDKAAVLVCRLAWNLEGQRDGDHPIGLAVWSERRMYGEDSPQLLERAGRGIERLSDVLRLRMVEHGCGHHEDVAIYMRPSRRKRLCCR